MWELTSRDFDGMSADETAADLATCVCGHGYEEHFNARDACEVTVCGCVMFEYGSDTKE